MLNTCGTFYSNNTTQNFAKLMYVLHVQCAVPILVHLTVFYKNIFNILPIKENPQNSTGEEISKAKRIPTEKLSSQLHITINITYSPNAISI